MSILKNKVIQALVAIGFIGIAAAQVGSTTTISDLEGEQTRLFNEKGEYVQIRKDGTALDGAFDQRKLPENTWVNVYDAPCGKGYDIVTETATSVVSRGFGCDSETRTWVRPKPKVRATST